MPGDRFDAIWVPRVGAEAAALLRKRALLLFPGLAMFAFVIAMAVAQVSSTTYYAVLLPVGLAYLCAHLYVLRRFNRRIAAAMSTHLGVHITSADIPPTRNIEQFDRAVEVLKGTRQAKETSLFGGFIKIRRP